MEAGYIGARNGSTAEGCPGHCTGFLSYLDCVDIYQKPVTWGRTPNDSSEAWCRQRIRNRIAAWKADHEWATFGALHTQTDWDSAHVDWALDEITGDGGVWVATFGEICEYVRQFHVTVVNPVEAGNDSATASAVLCGLPVGQWIYVVAVAYDTCGVESGWSNEVACVAQECQSAVASGPAGSPGSFRLGRPRPQPANPGVSVPIWIERPGFVDLRLYDVRGRLVHVLVQDRLPSGPHTISWDGRDASGSPLPSGLYFCRLSLPHGSAAERIVLIR